MIWKRASLGLGLFSLALGAVELLAPKRIGRKLRVEDHSGLIRAFGAREIGAGLGLLQAPANSSGVWARVAGDVMDLGALGLAARRGSSNKAALGALAFVGSITLLDVLVARGLDRTTGKTFPVGEPVKA